MFGISPCKKNYINDLLPKNKLNLNFPTQIIAETINVFKILSRVGNPPLILDFYLNTYFFKNIVSPSSIQLF